MFVVVLLFLLFTYLLFIIITFIINIIAIIIINLLIIIICLLINLFYAHNFIISSLHFIFWLSLIGRKVKFNVLILFRWL